MLYKEVLISLYSSPLCGLSHDLFSLIQNFMLLFSVLLQNFATFVENIVFHEETV